MRKSGPLSHSSRTNGRRPFRTDTPTSIAEMNSPAEFHEKASAGCNDIYSKGKLLTDAGVNLVAYTDLFVSHGRIRFAGGRLV